MTSFYTREELSGLGLKSFGEDVLLSRKASIYFPETISLGSHVRIDDFCILSGQIEIGSFVHISAYTAIYARYGVQVKDFVTISARNLIFSQSDDYSGEFMTNPMIPNDFRHVRGGRVTFEPYSIIGAGSIILPGITIGEGSAVGAMSLMTSDAEPWKIYAGIPAKIIKDRSRNILQLVKKIPKDI
jgi:galactoside O-acetyltransferase